MSDAPIDWLLKSEPWTEYRTRLDLLGESPDEPSVISARNRMINHPKVRIIVKSLLEWPGPVVNSHKSAGSLFHLLPFLADLGFTKTDEHLPEIIDKVLGYHSEEGPFQVLMNIPVHFGGTGTDSPAWALCDAPRIVYALARLGLGEDDRVIKARDYLMDLARDNGFPCVVSKRLGKFRGPGKKDDPCPYATLIMLELMSSFETLKSSATARDSVESLLDIWDNSQTRHPYMFFMGTDFRKPKAPMIWFDILHVADSLSNFSFALQDTRFVHMMEVMKSKATTDGKYIPESVWKFWSDWEFAQKKVPSAWLTFQVWRVLKRVNG